MNFVCSFGREEFFFCLFQRCLTIVKGMKIPGQLHLERVTRFRSKFNWLVLSFSFPIRL